jgi:glucosamine-6-phosphate deaminase
LKTSKFEAIYPPTEKIPTIVVEYFPARASCRRFVFGMGSGPSRRSHFAADRKTPEHFIKWVQYFLGNWDCLTSSRTGAVGCGSCPSPRQKSLHFVHIDEFYPMESSRHNSFYYYVNTFYIQGSASTRPKPC